MPRRRRVPKRQLMPDPKFKSTLVTRFVNNLMKDGKKSMSPRTSFMTLSTSSRNGLVRMAWKFSRRPCPAFSRSSRSRAGGSAGATYQVPVEIRSERRIALAIRWLISFSKARSEKTMAERLAMEFDQASKNQGASVKKRDDTHKMAEANKAFAHYRW